MKHYQTEQRQKILRLFETSAHDAFSAYEIFEKLDSPDISMSSIYRNLKDMETRGILHKVIEKGRREALYQYVNPQTCEGIIHLKCKDCQNTYHLDDEISRTVTSKAQYDFGFSLSASAAFLYGQCKECSQSNSISLPEQYER